MTWFGDTVLTALTGLLPLMILPTLRFLRTASHDSTTGYALQRQHDRICSATASASPSSLSSFTHAAIARLVTHRRRDVAHGIGCNPASQPQLRRLLIVESRQFSLRLAIMWFCVVSTRQKHCMHGHPLLSHQAWQEGTAPLLFHMRCWTLFVPGSVVIKGMFDAWVRHRSTLQQNHTWNHFNQESSFANLYNLW